MPKMHDDLSVALLPLLLWRTVDHHPREAIPQPQGCLEGQDLRHGYMAGFEKKTGQKRGYFEELEGSRSLGSAQCWRKKRAEDG